MAGIPSGRWKRSSYSMGAGNCVETTQLPFGQVAVRDSKDPHGGMLELSSGQWRGLLGSIAQPGPAGLRDLIR